MKIRSVYLVGLGAIGAKYASRLYDLDPHRIKILASPDRQQRLQNLTVNGKPYAFDFLDPAEAAPAADLILVAVKAPQLPEAIESLKHFVGPNTIVMSLMNGIGSEDRIAEAIGPQHLLRANVYMDATRDGNAFRYVNIGRVVFGEDRNETLTPRVLAVRDLLNAADAPNETPLDMRHAQWAKFMLNVGVNQASVVLRANFRVFHTNAFARALMLSAAREVVALSVPAGVPLTESDVQNFVAVIDALDPEAKTSMLQDIEAGRPTEVEIFAGEVIALGKRYGVPTPVNETFYRIIRAMEDSH